MSHNDAKQSTRALRLSIADACIEISTSSPEDLLYSLKSDFARRYLPTVSTDDCPDIVARVHWLRGGSFQVLSVTYSDTGVDVYAIQSDYPEAYVNESPVFFLLQVFARSLAKKGYVVLTDSVVVKLKTKAVLLLGFPHTGKSTMSSIAINEGYAVCSTENTVVRVVNGVIHNVTGTRVLVFDPRVRELYGVTIRSTGKTKHGYEILDLDALTETSPSNLRVPIDEIYVIYTSFNSSGASIVPIKGRKVEKILWYFATSLIKGMDYYHPQPLDMPLGNIVSRTINEFLSVARDNYAGRFFEAFGSPLDLLRTIASHHFLSFFAM